MSSAFPTIAALLISAAALAIALFTSLRQLRLMQGGNTLPVILDGFKRWRLPSPAGDHVQLIGGFFDDLGKLVAHGARPASEVYRQIGLRKIPPADAAQD